MGTSTPGMRSIIDDHNSRRHGQKSPYLLRIYSQDPRWPIRDTVFYLVATPKYKNPRRFFPSHLCLLFDQERYHFFGFFDSTLDHHHLHHLHLPTYLHLSHLSQNIQPANDEIHDYSGYSCPLYFYNHPHHQRCLNPKNSLSEREGHMARWGTPPRQMGPRPETRERYEPHRDCLSVQEWAFGHRCVNEFLEGGLETLDLIIFCFIADHPLAKSFELIDGNVFVTIERWDKLQSVGRVESNRQLKRVLSNKI